MIRSIFTASIILLSTMLSSCSSLKSQYYVGEKQPITEEDLKEESIWKIGEDVFNVRVVDTNTVIASSMKWDERTNKHIVSSSQLVLSELGHTKFLNVKDDDLYTILRLVGGSDGDSFAFLTVDAHKVERDIAEGKVKAHKEGSDIIMDGSKEELDAYIQENINTLFSVEGAGIAHLISEK